MKPFEWLSLDTVEAGQEVLVHIMWSPYPGISGFFPEPPPAPLDLQLGYWHPISQVPEYGFFDRNYRSCSDRWTLGVVNLFQEDPDVVSIEVLGQDYQFARELQYLITEVPEGYGISLSEDGPVEGECDGDCDCDIDFEDEQENFCPHCGVRYPDGDD